MRLLTLAIIGGTLGMIAAALYKAPNIRQALTTAGPEFNNLHPRVQAAALAVIENARAAGLTVGIYSGFRTLDEQRATMDAGASRTKNPQDSYHAWGLAVDFVFLDSLGRWTWLPDKQNPTNRGYRDSRWYTLGAIIERAGFEWGGRWAWFDGAHAQMPSIARPADLQARYSDPLQYVGQFA